MSRKLAKPAGRRKLTDAGSVVSSVVMITVMILCAVGAFFGDYEFDDDTTVERPATADSQALSDYLAQAHREQGICYGWHFKPYDGSYDSSVTAGPFIGSNFGVGESVEDHVDECPRSVVATITVSYTPHSSELSDSASVVVTTAGLQVSGSTLANDLEEQFDVTEKALIDEPVDTVGKAILALPLLVAEHGEADPLPPPAQPSGEVEALGPGGSDFWRSPTGTSISIAIVMLLVGVGFLVAAARRRAGHVRRTRKVSRTRRTPSHPGPSHPARVSTPLTPRRTTGVDDMTREGDTA